METDVLLWGLSSQAWITIVLVVGMFITLMKTRIPADVVFLAVMALLVICGCLPAAEALKGFSSSTVVVVGALYIVVAGLEASGVLHWIVKNLLGTPGCYWKAIVRLMLPVAVLSAFLTNTTVVALFINVVKIWAKKLSIAPSKLLIPLSYAAGMGGVCTLIGTPPNLIISGFYSEASGESLSMFSTTLPGLFCLLVGVGSIMAMQKLLPVRKSPEEELNAQHSSTTELHVLADSSLPGQTLADIHLLEDCKACELIGIVRYDGEVVNSVTPDEFLMGGDVLIFTGQREEVLKLGKRYGMACDILDEEVPAKGSYRTLLSSLIMLGMVLLSGLKVLPLLTSCFIAALLMLVTRCCDIKKAKKAINWDVLMVFACSITLGKAIDATGLAQILADHTAELCGSNALLAFILICTLGTFLTEFISNTACGALMAPIAIKIALSMGANPLTFCMGLMISCSSSFATPIGSPTHLMVYVPGGYRFTDFLRIGLPMNFIILAANVLICCILYSL